MPSRRAPAEFDPGDSDGDNKAQYPTELFESASAEGVDAWASPTKSSKRYQHTLKRRKTHGRGRRRPEKVDEGNRGRCSDDEVDQAPVAITGWDCEDPDQSASPARGPVDDVIAGPDLGSDESILTAYAELVDAAVAVFQHIGDGIFVVQGWDARRKQLTLGNEVGVAFYETESLLEQNPLGDYGDPRAAVFLRQPVPNTTDITTMFSVKSLSSSALKGRAIVQHTGTLPWKGTWKCSKEPGNIACPHIKIAFEVLREELKGLLGELDEDTEFDPTMFGSDSMVGGEGLAKLAHSGAVSHLPILPPISAGLKSDPPLYPRPPPFRTAPSAVFKLNSQSSCPCPGGRTFFDPGRPTVVRQCRIYTLCAPYDAEIEVQSCPTCPRARRRLIGPDLREFGLFNFNNSSIVSHELLDEYTMSYVTSETPFVAWCSVVGHRYTVSGSQFMSDGYFLPIWFSYATLLALDNDMSCLRCGPYPETTIWDGITLAFGKKHLAATLRPPTKTSATASITRTKTKHHPRQQLLVDEELRLQLRLSLDVPRNSGASKTPDPQDPEVLDHLERIEWVSEELQAVCGSLALLFLKGYGATPFSEGRRPPSCLDSFFKQIAAEESVLQMINGAALEDLNIFIADPIPANVTRVLSIPGLYKILQNGPELKGFILPIPELLPMVKWLANRATEVLRELMVEAESLDSAISCATAVETLDWRVTGCIYSLPQIRYRPIYSKLRGDGQKDKSSKRGDRCGKYYSQYGEGTLTGGIMVAWCTHSICYGFHCIPESEGRNDVFSALVTRWPTAPKRIIYDFACALGPYCMLREPKFFEKTFFAIDHFHAAGHSKCSPAAFLSEYANADPRLVPINSSAGECGNSSLKKIRKSVRYMGQERAILYTKVFLSMWNRLRLRAMQI
ncbi:hypothetical protein MD484_g1311, partial [Candolleomyces efflorescens]